ncbi:MAG: L-aspartate oxidase, partial [Armatimonadetes bacterium]|nr:L-aspartate oxidase [Armatimonadota bacterium]
MISRYLTSFDPSRIRQLKYDYVILGSGIAGLWCALEAMGHGSVAIVTKGPRDEGSTKYAQGGIAAALCPQDSPALHLQDTMDAGAGLCNREAVSVLVTEGPQRVKQLVRRGAEFDQENGQLVLAREGAHGIRRIVRAQGDQTGREVERALIAEIQKSRVDVHEKMFGVDLLTQRDECVGVLGWSVPKGEFVLFRGEVTIIASGGAGQLFDVTTNPTVVTGDGAAMAFRAGAQLQDLEFMQFHPTALASVDESSGDSVSPKFLISEAVRGEGAQLLNLHGERFMPHYHPLAELAPRDVVSKSILEEMHKTHTKHVLLDLTAHSREAIQHRFPTIFRTCEEQGIDPSAQPIPVSPAAHYTMGGVKTGLNGETNIRRLYACGEAACTGVHGANRLASNSLLEGMVFGSRAVTAARRMVDRQQPVAPDLSAIFVPTCPRGREGKPPERLRKELQTVMWRQVGLLRSDEALQDAVTRIDMIQAETARLPEGPKAWELTNM